MPRLRRSLPLRGARGGQRRLVTWSEGPSGTSGSITASGTALFSVGGQATINDQTIVRTRGQLSFLTNGAPTAVDNMVYAFGICIVSENAFGVGVTAVPAPLTDVFWDGWLYHVQGVAGLVPGNVGGTSAAVEIDSKAMRKIHFSDVVIGVLEVVETGTVILTALLQTRLLTKLP